MTKISVLTAFLLQLGTIKAVPCSPDFYEFITKPGSSEISAEIRIPPPRTPLNNQYHLKVGFNTQPDLHTSFPIARLDVAESKQEIIQAAAENRTLYYKIHYPFAQPIPKLIKITFNDVMLCNQESQSVRTNVEIEKTVSTIEEESPSTSGPELVNPFLQPHAPPLSVQNDTTTPGSTTDNGCGKPTIKYNGTPNLLVVRGVKTRPGEWPWLAAIFAATTVEQYQFQCGGSIITTKHIVTAGHCLKLNNNVNDTLPPSVLLVALGRFNLTHWRERGSLNQEVASYAIHPDYEHYRSGDSDLAILTLRKAVQYSLYIRPICLWSGPLELENVVNKNGYVVGWGEDETQRPFTEDPRMARVPIVSQLACLRSDRIFYDLTSERTLCAGWLSERVGPCNGDSGSGLMVFNDTTHRYELRGIVSRSTYDEIRHLCNLQKYVVYTDVAQYLPWILDQISK